MAKTGEDQRDPLFDMNVGDGLIEVNVEEKPVVETTEDDKGKEKKEPPGVIEPYDDGTFEIDDTPSETTEAATATEQQEFIDKTDKETEDKKTPSKTPSDSSSSSPYLAFAQDRAKEGVFLDFNEGDWKTLVERNEGDEAAALKELSVISMQEMVNTGVENYKNSITDEERTLYEAKERGLPLDAYSIAKRNYDKYSKIKEDDLSDNE
jgi:hypothetical protein